MIHMFITGGYGGIGRRARFRFWWETVQVQVLLSAPDNDNPNPVPTGDDFGFLVYLLERKEKWWYRGDTAIFAFENNFNR